ncbi:MAG: DUF2634 domain-containing protein [Candidatus Nanopelagicales bacterium]
MGIEVTPTVIAPDQDPLQIAEESLAGLTPAAIGTDVAFDFERGEIVLSGTAGQLQVTRGNKTIAQWIMSALSTDRGRMTMYPAWFGSGISDAIASGMVDTSLIEREINETVSAHDRVRGVTDVVAERDVAHPETVYVSFTAVMDNGDRIRFGKVPLG